MTGEYYPPYCWTFYDDVDIHTKLYLQNIRSPNMNKKDTIEITKILRNTVREVLMICELLKDFQPPPNTTTNYMCGFSMLGVKLNDLRDHLDYLDKQIESEHEFEQEIYPSQIWKGNNDGRHYIVSSIASAGRLVVFWRIYRDGDVSIHRTPIDDFHSNFTLCPNAKIQIIEE